MSGSDPRTVDEDWSGQDLSGREFSGIELVRVDLSETVSDGGLVFDECVFRDVDLTASRHTGAAFTNCRFHGTTLAHARLAACKLVGSTFASGDFTGLVVDGGDWSFTGLAQADLRGVRITGVRMRETDLRGVDATRAELRDCDLADARWERAVLERCDLRGSDLMSMDPTTVRLGRAVISWQQAIVVAHGYGLVVEPD